MSLRNIPNRITIGRLLLSIIFFVLLAMCHVVPAPDRGVLLTCFVLYILAGLTDLLDGYLARRWQVTSAFGRIADPFVDKVIVCGAFALLAGPNFAFGRWGPISELERQMPAWLHGGMASAVQGWMVVVLIAREFIVSGIRGFSESQGLKFPATSAGKIKMFVQSFAICAVLFQLAFLRQAPWAVVGKIAAVWVTVIVTVGSGLTYVGKARRILGEATRG